MMGREAKIPNNSQAVLLNEKHQNPRIALRNWEVVLWILASRREEAEAEPKVLCPRISRQCQECPYLFGSKETPSSRPYADSMACTLEELRDRHPCINDHWYRALIT
jgi:hypothetical protein